MIETRVKMSAKFLKLNEVYEFIETLERQHKTKFVKQKCTKELEEINDFGNHMSFNIKHLNNVTYTVYSTLYTVYIIIIIVVYGRGGSRHLF
jgi:predicted S18 family serine protease